MFSRKLVTPFLFSQQLNTCRTSTKQYLPKRNLQVSLIGAANNIGSNLALLLKQNKHIKKLQLYDDDLKIKGIGLELSLLPGGPEVTTFTGDGFLNAAIRKSDVILMVYRIPRKPGCSREQMIATNAPAVHKLCRAIANDNPNAFVAIATNPINSMVPFASTLMYKYGAYNPFKMFGITHIDSARARTLTASALKVNPLDVSLPVIGGHSDDTIVPLFSNMIPNTTAMDPFKAETLTRLIRKAGSEVIFQKHGKESSTLAMAMAVHEFVRLIIKALQGNEVMVNCYTANPNYGTRFFSGPTKIGPYGVSQACYGYQLSDYETFLLNAAVPVLNRDVCMGEDYVRFVETAGKY